MLLRTIALSNQKGGSGKTTTAVNLAACLAERGRRVLLIDMDPQANASTWLGVRDGGKALHNALLTEGDLAAAVRETTAPGVQIVPGSQWTARVEKALAGEQGAECVLRERLADMAPVWDYILIDCPPALGMLAVNALVAAREVLVPTDVTVLGLEGVRQLETTIRRVREKPNPALLMAGIVPTRIVRTVHARDVLEALRERYADLVLPGIRQNTDLASAPSFELPITLHQPDCIGAQDYRVLAGAVIDQEEGI